MDFFIGDASKASSVEIN